MFVYPPKISFPCHLNGQGFKKWTFIDRNLLKNRGLGSVLRRLSKKKRFILLLGPCTAFGSHRYLWDGVFCNNTAWICFSSTSKLSFSPSLTSYLTSISHSIETIWKEQAFIAKIFGIVCGADNKSNDWFNQLLSFDSRWPKAIFAGYIFQNACTYSTS